MVEMLTMDGFVTSILNVNKPINDSFPDDAWIWICAPPCERDWRNFVVLITVCVILVAYLVGLGICYWFDARDARRNVGLTIMADLKVSPTSRFYLITVATGYNCWAGTTSSVSMTMYGSNGRSQVFTLKNRSHNVFYRGGVNTFLVSCDKDLGKLERIRIWTDFSGTDPAWYCRKILIKTFMGESESWHFYINKWLRVTAEESSVILDVPVTTKANQRKFLVRFKENLMQQLDDVNLLASIFRSSPGNPFTRCERLTCAMAILATYLLLDGVMDVWFHGTPTRDKSGMIELGVRRWSIDVYAFIKAVCIVGLSLPFGVIVVILFRNIRPRYIPTVIIWNNVIPAQTQFGGKNMYIPKPKDETEVPSARARRQTLMSQLEEDNDDHDYGLRPKKFSIVSSRESSSDSIFSIPSTDIPVLEGWIEERARADPPKNAAEGDNYSNSDAELHNQRFIFSLDGVKDEDRQAHSVFRLGRRAIVHSVRDRDPNSFIFEGENDITDVENLIDKQIASRKKVDKKKTKGRDDEADGESYRTREEPHHPQFATVGNKYHEAPWTEVVTEEYLEDLDQILEEELKTKHIMQEKANWIPQVAFEICLLPSDIRSCLIWPWWFIYIAWTVSIIIILGNCTITVVFGNRYGYLRSRAWLESFVECFLISVFVVQPLKGCIMALLYTILGKSQSIHERFQIKNYDISDPLFAEDRLPYNFTVFEPISGQHPLKGNEIFRLTIAARRKKEVKDKLFRLILCALLIVPLIIIAYHGHDQDNYHVTENVRNMMQLNNLGEGKVKFRSEASVYNYIEHVVIANLHPRRLYNGDIVEPHNATLLSDLKTLLIGVPRIRQQRVKSAPCIEENITALSLPVNCHGRFKQSTQDRNSYNTRWEPVEGSRRPASPTNDGWEFHNQSTSLSFSGHQGYYDGGGYILELGRTEPESQSILKYMKRTRWLDHRTRAIFIEFTLLNPHVNKFVDVVLLIEQGPTWTFTVQSWISPILLVPFEDGTHLEDSLSLVLIAISLLVLTYLVVYDFWTAPKKLHYLQRANFWLNIVIIILVTACLCAALKKLLATREFVDAVDTDIRDEYVSIQNVAHWNYVQRDLFSGTQAIVFIKFWKLLMFTDKRFLTFALTLQLTSGFLMAFVFILTIFLVAFASSGYFLFGQHLWEFSTWMDSLTTLIDHILGVSLFDDFVDKHSILGPIYSFLFGFLIVFLGLNFVVALLDLGVHEAKEVVHQRKVWLTYTSYFISIVIKAFPVLEKTRNLKKYKARENFSTLHPARLHGMKTLTAKFIREHVTPAWDKMHEMRNHLNKLLDGTGYTVVSKRRKAMLHEKVKHEHLEHLREMTVTYLRDKLGHEMQPDEFKEYSEFNSIIVKLRVQKLEKKLDQLNEKFEEFLDRT